MVAHAISMFSRMAPLNEAIRVARKTPGVAYPTIAINAKVEALSGWRGATIKAIQLTGRANAREVFPASGCHPARCRGLRRGEEECRANAKSRHAGSKKPKSIANARRSVTSGGPRKTTPNPESYSVLSTDEQQTD